MLTVNVTVKRIARFIVAHAGSINYCIIQDVTEVPAAEMKKIIKLLK